MSGLQIPPHFTRDLRAGRPAQAQLLIDGSNSTVALQALNTAVAIALTQSTEMLLKESGRHAVPVEIRPQMLYNPTMRSPNFFVPGVIGIVLQIGTTFATAMAVVREKERGTLEQLLVSPLSRWGLMLGKLIPYLCIGMLMAFLLFGIMHFVFFVPIAGSIVAMILATLVYVSRSSASACSLRPKRKTRCRPCRCRWPSSCRAFSFPALFSRAKRCRRFSTALGAVLPTTYFIGLMRAIILRGATFFEYAHR